MMPFYKNSKKKVKNIFENFPIDEALSTFLGGKLQIGVYSVIANQDTV